eukprot:12931089-Prorocentrum_lima.AAC.1
MEVFLARPPQILKIICVSPRWSRTNKRPTPTWTHVISDSPHSCFNARYVPQQQLHEQKCARLGSEQGRPA